MQSNSGPCDLWIIDNRQVNGLTAHVSNGPRDIETKLSKKSDDQTVDMEQ